MQALVLFGWAPFRCGGLPKSCGGHDVQIYNEVNYDIDTIPSDMTWYFII